MHWSEIETKWREMAHRTQAHWEAKTEFPKSDALPAAPRLPTEIAASGQSGLAMKAPVERDASSQATLAE
jgi:hypothetical protein